LSRRSWRTTSHVSHSPADTRPLAWACAVEPNHVHLLVSPLNEEVAKYAGRMKGRTSSEVRKQPRNQSRQRIWTADYWKVFLFDMEAVAVVKQYIEDHNVRRGLPAAPFPWLTPLVI
jgi:hypothetical protein